MSRLKRNTALFALVIALVGGFEGLRLAAYRDVVGIPTVCFGETRGVSMGDRYTREQCQTMLGEGLREFEAKMQACLKRPDAVPDPSYAAFLSFAYNVGTGAFCRSTLARKVNSGDLRGACDDLLRWDRAGGRRIKGLTNRRREERKLCLEGVP